MSYVLDATAMLAYLNNEPGVDIVEAALLDTSRTCFAHALNLAEVYYHFLRAADVATADTAIQTLLDLDVQAREDMDTTFWKDAGFLKATYPPLSLGDACCAALGRRLTAEILTSDHHEMEKLEAAAVCIIRFIR